MSPADVNGPKPNQSHEALWHQDVGLLAGVWLFITCAYVAGGAYDTDDFGLAHRILLWLIVSAFVVFQPAGLERLVSGLTPATPLGPWLSALIAILVAVPLVAIEVHLLKFTPLLPRQPDPWIEFIPFIAAPVIIVTSFVLFLRISWEHRYLEPALPAQDIDGAAGQAPAVLGPETLYVRSQDHYLEVVTEAGRRFIRGRLADLADEGAQFGFSPHRSWWVADQAVSTYRRTGRDGHLILSDGTRVPVSRSRNALVRDKGWA